MVQVNQPYLMQYVVPLWWSKGNILLDGEDITFKSEHARAKLIGRVFRIQ